MGDKRINHRVIDKKCGENRIFLYEKGIFFHLFK